MANSLNNLVPDLYEALDIVSREVVGFIPAVTHDASAERAAVNQTIRIPIAPASQAADIVPGQLPPDTGDQTIGNTTLQITKSRAVQFRWVGEEQRGLNTGAGYRNIRVNQIVQAMRTLTNEIEADLGALVKTASRAYGTAGTTPFASDLADPANVRKILTDNGAPLSDLQMVIDSTAGVNLRKMAQLTKANEAASDSTLRRGVLLDIHGFAIRESAGVANRTAGTGAGYLVNNSGGYPVGTTAITVDTGTGTVLAGDIVTFNGDTNKYVVASALAANVITLAAPGLRKAVADNAAVTVGASYTGNFAFNRNALVLVTRAPALPEEGDSAKDRMLITDPVSGLTFEISMYTEYRRIHYEVATTWGMANIKPEHTAALLG